MTSEWRTYLSTLYGSRHVPVRPRDVYMIYSAVIPRNLSLDDTFGPLSRDCNHSRPSVRHEHQFKQWDVPSAQYVRNRSSPTLPRLGSDQWVEVTHCAERVRRRKECSRPSHCLEQQTYFMYVRPGSGVWYNTGRTASFPSHASAFESCNLTLPPPLVGPFNLSGASASPMAADAAERVRLRAEFAARYYAQQRTFAALHNGLAACLRRRGLTSVQFTGRAFHPQDDRWCNQPVMEIVDVTTTGLGCLGDHLELRSGWHGSGPRITQCWNGCAVPPQVCSELRKRALAGRVKPGARCNSRTLHVASQHSISPCIPNQTFGCVRALMSELEHTWSRSPRARLSPSAALDRSP